MKKYKSGSNIPIEEALKFSGFLTNLIPPNQDVSKLKGQKFNQNAREVVGSVADSAIPGLGTAIDIGGKVADSLKEIECDEVTGECVEVTKGGKNFLSNVLDPTSRALDAGRNLVEGNYKGVLDELTFGLTNFDKSDEDLLKKIKQQKLQRELNKQNKASNVLKMDRIANERMQMLQSDSFNSTYKLGGELNYLNKEIKKEPFSLKQAIKNIIK